MVAHDERFGIVVRDALARDQLCASALAERWRERACSSPQSKTLDWDSAMARVEAEVGEDTKLSASLEDF